MSYGISDSYCDRIAQIESGGNPEAHARTSSACGLYQFTTATWEGIRRQAPELGLTDDPDGRLDPDQALAAFRWLTEQDGAQFRRMLGRDPEPYERYLMHFLGGFRGAQVSAARADKPLSLVLGPAYHAVARANPFAAGMTAGQLQAWSRAKVGDCS